MNLEKILYQGSELLGVELDNTKVQRFFEYLNLLTTWNKKLNLTSITDEKEIIIKHFIDSLTIVNLLDKNHQLLDIGSGGGFPGIPIAIANPFLDITLLDAAEKKVVFMKEVIRRLELNNVVAKKGRADNPDNSILRKSFDYVVARAVGDIDEIVNYSIPYINSTGKIIIMRGKKGEGEWNKFVHDTDINNISDLDVRINKLVLPYSDYERVIIVMSQ